MTYDLRNPYTWPAQAVKDAENSSPTTQHSHGPEQEVSQILLDRVIRLEELLMAQSRKIDQLLAALAEDQDPDDMPSTYLDGSKV